jgi:hypothetical protein
LTPKLIFSPAKLKVKSLENGQAVWDVVRKKFVKLTPEEWVRQHLIHELISLGYPAALMQVEKVISLNDRKLRPDLVVYLSDGTFFLLAECKAPEVALSQDTLFQSAQYLQSQKANYLVMTNGIEICTAKLDSSPILISFGLPVYPKR